MEWRGSGQYSKMPEAVAGASIEAPSHNLQLLQPDVLSEEGLPRAQNVPDKFGSMRIAAHALNAFG